MRDEEGVCVCVCVWRLGGTTVLWDEGATRSCHDAATT